MQTASEWTGSDTERAKRFWQEYQETHDVSDRRGQAAGIDPVSGRVWFGEDGLDVKRQMRKDGVDRPFYCVRVGCEYYLRKGVLLERASQ